MNYFSPVLLVFISALITAVATWLGALPFAFVTKMSKKRLWVSNAIAAGLMLAASFGLMVEGNNHNPWWVVLWVLIWLVFIVWAKRFISRYDKKLHFGAIKWANATKILLIVWVMTVHSFAEWVAIGVWFWPWAALWVIISLALALHNIPEWLAISLVLVPRGVKRRKAWLRSIFSSLPQPLMAIPAFLFVQQFTPLLPVWLGFAAWAMIWMSFSELLPDAINDTPREVVATIATIAIMGMLVFQQLIGW